MGRAFVVWTIGETADCHEVKLEPAAEGIETGEPVSDVRLTPVMKADRQDDALYRSAVKAGEQVAKWLYDRGYTDKEVSFRFQIDQKARKQFQENGHGSSADLSFALGAILEFFPEKFPSLCIVASGELQEEQIHRIGSLGKKVKAAREAVPENTRFFYPDEMKSDLRSEVEQSGLSFHEVSRYLKLIPVKTLTDVCQQLDIDTREDRALLQRLRNDAKVYVETGYAQKKKFLKQLYQNSEYAANARTVYRSRRADLDLQTSSFVEEMLAKHRKARRQKFAIFAMSALTVVALITTAFFLNRQRLEAEGEFLLEQAKLSIQRSETNAAHVLVLNAMTRLIDAGVDDSWTRADTTGWLSQPAASLVFQSAPLTDHSQYLATSFSPNGQYVANITSSTMGILNVWDPVNGNRVVVHDTQLLPEPAYEDYPRAFDFSPNSHTLAVGFQDRIIQFNLNEPIQQTSSHKLDGSVESLKYHPSGTHLGIATGGGAISLFDLASGEEEQLISPTETWGLEPRIAFSSDGKKLAAIEPRGVWHLWSKEEDPPAWREMRFETTKPFNNVQLYLKDLSFNESGSIVAFASSGKIELHATEDGEPIGQLNSDFFKPSRRFSKIYNANGLHLRSPVLAVNNRGTLLAKGRAQCGRDKQREDCVAVYRADQDGQMELAFSGLGGASEVAFSPDNQHFAVAGDEYFRVWNLETPEHLLEEPYGPKYPYQLSVSDDGGHVAVSTMEGGVRLWDLNDKSRLIKLAEPTWTISYEPEDDLIGRSPTVPIAIAPTPDGTSVVYANASGLVWRRADGTTTKISGIQDRISSIAYDSLSGDVVAGTDKGALWKIDLTTSPVTVTQIWQDPIDEPTSNPAITALAVHPDKDLVAIGNKVGAVRLISTTIGNAVHVLDAPNHINDLAFGSKGERLTSVSQSGQIFVWKFSGSEVTLEHKFHGERKDRVALHPTRPIIAIGGLRGHISLYSLESGDLIKVIKSTKRKPAPRVITSIDPGYAIKDIAISKDGNTLYYCSVDGLIHVWSLRAISEFDIYQAVQERRLGDLLPDLEQSLGYKLDEDDKPVPFADGVK